MDASHSLSAANHKSMTMYCNTTHRSCDVIIRSTKITKNNNQQYGMAVEIGAISERS